MAGESVIAAFFNGGRGTGHADRSCFEARVNGDEDHAQTVDFGSGSHRGRADGGYRAEPGRRASPAQPAADGGHPARRLGRRAGSWEWFGGGRDPPGRRRGRRGRRLHGAPDHGPVGPSAGAGQPRPPGACRRPRLADPAAAVPGGRRPRRDAGRRSRRLRAVVEIRITARLRPGLRSWSQPRSRSRLRSSRAAAMERSGERAARTGVITQAPGTAARLGGLPKRHPACLRYLYR